jgi:hypothetical protein
LLCVRESGTILIMSLRKPLVVCALAAAAMSMSISIGAVAQACPSSRVRLSPAPGTTLTKGTPIVIDGLSLDALEARGPILWSADDVVPLRVVANRGTHIELAVDRDLIDGTRYALAVTRSPNGVALANAAAPIRYGFWTGGSTPRVAEPRHARGLGWARGLAFFGLAPFLASFGLTGFVLRRRRRRIVRSILL